MMLHVSHRFHTRANDLMITKAARCALGPRAPGWQTSASNINTIDDGRIESSANCLPFSESCEPEEAVEKAAARICREGGARVTTNTRLADLNINHLSRVDDRCIEVIANGFPMRRGSKVAVHTTLVSPLTRSGGPRSRGRTYAGAALQDARGTRKERIPNSYTTEHIA